MEITGPERKGRVLRDTSLLIYYDELIRKENIFHVKKLLNPSEGISRIYIRIFLSESKISTLKLSFS